MSDVAQQKTKPISVLLAGQEIVLDVSGAIYLPDHDTLIVADLHFEKSSSFARRGQFLPPYDTARTLALLTQVIAHYHPRAIIALGDSFHDSRAHERLSDDNFVKLSTLTSMANWIWISGNHDPLPMDDLAGLSVDEFEIGALKLRHEPTINGHFEIAGHLHPCAKIIQRGRHIRRKAFVGDANRLIMPAFGALTGSLNCYHPAFEGLFDKSTFHVHMIGTDAVHKIAPSRLIA